MPRRYSIRARTPRQNLSANKGGDLFLKIIRPPAAKGEENHRLGSPNSPVMERLASKVGSEPNIFSRGHGRPWNSSRARLGMAYIKEQWAEIMVSCRLDEA